MNELLLWGFGLIGVGLVLAVLEVFVPSAGVIALVSASAAIAGVVAFFRYDTVWGVVSLVGVVVAGVSLFNFALKVLPYTPVGKGLILGGGASGEEAARVRAEAERAEAAAAAALIGVEGEALTDCRPVGSARLEGERLEVLAVGGMIEEGSRVRVVSVEGKTVRVRAV